MSRAVQSLTDLPVLTGLTALSLGLAVLHVEGGLSVTVGAEPIFLPGDPPFVLSISDGQHWRLYAVPDHLHATIRAALNLRRIDEAPPVLTLTDIDRQPDAVTFQAVNQDGQAVALSVPRPVDVQPTFHIPRALGVPVDLHVTGKVTAPGQGFTFKVYPETPNGWAVLELLDYAERVSLSLEGVQPSHLAA